MWCKVQTPGKPFPLRRGGRSAIRCTRGPSPEKGPASRQGCWADTPLPADRYLLPPWWQPKLQAAMPRETGLSHLYAFASNPSLAFGGSVDFQLRGMSPLDMV